MVRIVCYRVGSETNVLCSRYCIWGSYWRNDLFFRDFLRKNPERAKQYAKLKEQLAGKYADNRATYISNKEQFINKTLEIIKNFMKKEITINDIQKWEKSFTKRKGISQDENTAIKIAIFKLVEETGEVTKAVLENN